MELPSSSFLGLNAGGPAGFVSRGLAFHLGRFLAFTVNLLNLGGGVKRVVVVEGSVVVLGVVVKRVVGNGVVVVVVVGIVQLIPVETHWSASFT